MLASSYTNQNRILSIIPETEYPILFENLELVNLHFQQILYLSGQPIDYVYFPLQSVVSLSSVAQDQSLSEVLLIGNEGLVGLSAFLGSMDANNQTVVLVAGAALRIKKTVFDTEVHRPGTLKDQLLAYTHIRLENLTQNVACKSHHKIQQQLARWLLSIHDRIEGKRLLLTQPYIAQRFGVRRASITEAAVKLQETGCISYRRGEILIVDPGGLEAQACSCYRAVKSIIVWEHHAETASDPCNATVDFKGATVPKSE